MKITLSWRITILAFTAPILLACSADKLEARLQADPQCKTVMNPKTGALMPCPGTDKEFYKSIPALNTNKPELPQPSGIQASAIAAPSAPKNKSAPVECKPQLHQKSGSLMPCPAP